MILSEDASLKLGAACGASEERPLVSILLVNYKTPLQTKLCLRSLRKFTTHPHEIIVVDNGSEDESLRYLEGLRWITLLKNTDPNPSHRNGLELARKAAKGSWILILHSDAFVRAAGWLEAILAYAKPSDLMIASQDRVILPLDGPWGWTARMSLWRTRRVRKMLWASRGLPPKLISHCALFRRALFAEPYNQRFDKPVSIDRGRDMDCGEDIQRDLESLGLGICWLSREQLAPWIYHFEGATLNLVTGRRLHWRRRIRSWLFYRQRDIRAILADESLDA